MILQLLQNYLVYINTADNATIPEARALGEHLGSIGALHAYGWEMAAAKSSATWGVR